MSWLPQLSRPRLFGALFAVIAVVLGLIVATVVSTRNASTSEPLYLEQAADAGPKPFVPVAKDRARSTAGRGCDTFALITRLSREPDVLAAWSSAAGKSPEQLGVYIHSLRPMQLSEDTHVTNHQYDDGDPVAVQAVLQRGTHVLVDAAGTPKVRCASGNPLGPPSQLKAAAKPEYVGTAWPRFKPPTVVVERRVDAPRQDRVVERDRERTVIERDRLVPVPIPVNLAPCPPAQYLGNDGYCYPVVPVGQVDGPCAPGYYRANDGNCYLLPEPPDADNPAPVTNPVVACPDGSAPQQGNCPIVVDPVPPVVDPNQAPQPDGQPVVPPVVDPAAALTPEQIRALMQGHEAAGHLTPEQVAVLRELERQLGGGTPAVGPEGLPLPAACKPGETPNFPGSPHCVPTPPLRECGNIPGRLPLEGAYSGGCVAPAPAGPVLEAPPGTPGPYEQGRCTLNPLSCTPLRAETDPPLDPNQVPVDPNQVPMDPNQVPVDPNQAPPVEEEYVPPAPVEEEYVPPAPVEPEYTEPEQEQEYYEEPQQEQEYHEYSE